VFGFVGEFVDCSADFDLAGTAGVGVGVVDPLEEAWVEVRSSFVRKEEEFVVFFGMVEADLVERDVLRTLGVSLSDKVVEILI